MSAKTRRALFYENDDNFEPSIIIDVNEYLIETWPQLTLTQRQSVWTLAKDDEDFDLDPIHDQLDNIVYELAETDSTIELPESDEEDEEDEDEEGESGTAIHIELFDHLDSEWPDLTEEQKEDVVGYIVEQWEEDNMETDIYDAIDNAVYDYGTTIDTSIDVSSMEDDEDEEEEDEDDTATE